MSSVLLIGLLCSVLFWNVAWYWDTASSMAAIWWRSETFAHGMVVYPLSTWMIWRNRAALSGLTFRPSYFALLVLAVAGFGWLLGELGGVQAARQFCLAVMLAAAVWAVLGTRAARELAFPLAFTLLAVPVGEFLMPTLIEHTADFTVGALRLTGIPVYREGNNFVIPSGSWSVVEACSGLRYLIASVTLGLLYAYLSYRSMLRRVMFVAASVVVPIVANWIRAYLIVMIGHLSGMKYAVGVDHLIYGWVFFGIVMLLLFWIGSYWREDSHEMPTAEVSAGPRAVTMAPSVVVGAVLASAVVTVAPVYAGFLASSDEAVVGEIVAPAVAGGWTRVQSGSGTFRPHYLGARGELDQVFERDGRRVGLFVGYYANQREGLELISHSNAISNTSDRSVARLGQGALSAGEAGLDVLQTRLRVGDSGLLVWHWYWAGGLWTTRPEVVKALQALGRLAGWGDDAAVVVVYAHGGSEAKTLDEGLRSFTRDMAPSILNALEQTRRLRRESTARRAASARARATGDKG